MAYVCAQLLSPPKAKWGVDDIPDLSGKVMIVTGGNAGIGKETIKALLQHDAKVYMASRNRTKALAAIAELRKQTGKEAIYLSLDLADLRSVKAAAREFMSQETRLHVLFNSGGVMFPPVEQLTADGYDLQFGTNVLGHFYLTQLLMPVLLSGASHSPEGRVRVINTSSIAHASVSGIDFDTLKEHAKRKKSGTQKLHFQSKFAMVVFSNELNRRSATTRLVNRESVIGTAVAFGVDGGADSTMGRDIAGRARAWGRIPRALGATRGSSKGNKGHTAGEATVGMDGGAGARRMTLWAVSSRALLLHMLFSV